MKKIFNEFKKIVASGVEIEYEYFEDRILKKAEQWMQDNGVETSYCSIRKMEAATKLYRIASHAVKSNLAPDGNGQVLVNFYNKDGAFIPFKDTLKFMSIDDFQECAILGLLSIDENDDEGTVVIGSY